jgi:hypothetical protein
VFYLCVVVKERAESCHPGHYTRMICLGKSFSNQVAGRAVARNLFSLCSRPPSLRSGAAFFAERKMVGVTGLEPVTLRLSSACSNQLSYTPPQCGLACRAVARSAVSWLSSRPAFALLRRGSLALSLRSERRLVELRGFEPLTYSLQSCRSTN